MNPMVENYKRCNFSYRQDDWDDQLQSNAFTYESSTRKHLWMSTFEVDFGISPFEDDLGYVPGTPYAMISGQIDLPGTYWWFEEDYEYIFGWWEVLL